MLVLSRKPKEWVTIECPNGDVIQVGLVDIDRNKARFGFVASAAYKIYRDELLPVIKEVSHASRHPVLTLNSPSEETPPETGSAVDRS